METQIFQMYGTNPHHPYIQRGYRPFVIVLFKHFPMVPVWDAFGGADKNVLTKTDGTSVTSRKTRPHLSSRCSRVLSFWRTLRYIGIIYSISIGVTADSVVSQLMLCFSRARPKNLTRSIETLIIYWNDVPSDWWQNCCNLYASRMTVHMSLHHLAVTTLPSGSPILSPVLFMHVGDPLFKFKEF